MGALLFFFLLFGGHPVRHCPMLQPETRPIYKQIEEVSFHDLKGNPHTIVKTPDGRFVNYTGATITVDSLGISGVQVGEKPDPEAIAYNKRVKECQTANGEF